MIVGLEWDNYCGATCPADMRQIRAEPSDVSAKSRANVYILGGYQAEPTVGYGSLLVLACYTGILAMCVIGSERRTSASQGL